MHSSKSLKKEQKLLGQNLFKRYTLVQYLLLKGAHWYILVLKCYIFIPFEKVTTFVTFFFFSENVHKVYCKYALYLQKY